MRFDNFQTKINGYKPEKKKGRKPASKPVKEDTIENQTDEQRLENIKIKEGYAGSESSGLKDKWTKFTGLKGKPNTRVKNSKGDFGLYYDKLGKLTSGRGHLVTSRKEALKHMNMTKDQAEKVFKKDVEKHDKDAINLANKLDLPYESWSKTQQNAYKDMVFQMGPGTFEQFKKTHSLLRRNKFEEASQEAKKSRWARQTPARYKDFDKRIRSTPTEEGKHIQDMWKGQEEFLKGKLREGAPKPQFANINREPASIEEQNMNGELGEKAALARKKREEEEQAAVGNEQKKIMVEEAMNTKIPNDPSLTPSENEDVKAQSNNRKAVENSVDRNMEKPNAKQGVGLKDQFLDALTFFGPQLLGGLLASGGKQDEYFVAGFNQGGKMRDAYLAQKNTEAKLQLQREQNRQSASLNKMDITPDFQTKVDGKPLWSRQNPQTGLPEFIDDTGKKYSSTEVVSMRQVEDQQRQESITGRHQQNLEQRDTDRVIKSLDNFVKRGDVMKTIQAMDSVGPVINMLKDSPNMPVSSEFLAPFIARGVQGEVGNLSETDLANARVPLDLGNRIKSNLSAYLTGDMSKEEREALIKMLEYVQERKQNQLEEKTVGYATQSEAERLGISQEQLEGDLRNRLGLKTKKVRKKVKITKEDIDKMDAAQLKEYLGE